MRKSFQHVIATLNLFQGTHSLTIFLLAAIFVLSSCDDSSSASSNGSDENAAVDSSSSVCKDCDDESSSSAKKIESSAEKDVESSDDAKIDESSSIKENRTSSSSVKTDDSSSSKKDVSSSSVSSSSSVKSSSSSSVKQSSSSVGFIDPDDVVTGTMTDSRDNKVYKTVTIGTQTWMAENLNYAYTSVPYKFDSKYGSYTSDSTSWCYDDDPSNCDKYGRLYTWAASMDSIGTWSTNGIGCGYGSTCSPTYPVRGICPTGWHLPTKAEFETLFTAVGGSFQAAKRLKSASGWEAAGEATDAYGFSALPAGARDNKGAFSSPGLYAYFWSATEFRDYAYNMFLYSNDEFAYLEYNYKYDGFSVRCVKDSD
ncbi:fibrobacter succinogenes major paralogous domain-containing protein [uncultured Fibrobacter sp.]|uniref:fibrobacter succinogenes major paralogous domain-containing protein n=1 Tax=uncultured Fibrobacter sp. TaxID=261512 RepID=UPI0025CD6ACA|nr:fibrobacter succinogenes major paralogous domain-containing protein [uncultured Fibrobacter sp.]